MKTRCNIGFFLAGSGIFVFVALLAMGVYHADSVYEWHGTKLWYTIFEKLDLNIPFAISILLFALGGVILGREYFEKK